MFTHFLFKVLIFLSKYSSNFKVVFFLLKSSIINLKYRYTSVSSYHLTNELKEHLSDTILYDRVEESRKRLNKFLVFIIIEYLSAAFPVYPPFYPIYPVIYRFLRIIITVIELWPIINMYFWTTFKNPNVLLQSDHSDHGKSGG